MIPSLSSDSMPAENLTQSKDVIAREDSVDDEDDDFVKVDDAVVAAQVEEAIAKLEKKALNVDLENSMGPPKEEEEMSQQNDQAPELTVSEEQLLTFDDVEIQDLSVVAEQAPLEENQAKEENVDNVKCTDELNQESRQMDAVSSIVEPDPLEKMHTKKESSDEVQTLDESKLERSQMEIGEWAAFAKDVFSLDHFPSAWEVTHLMDQCLPQDEKIWKRYFDARCLLAQACKDSEEEEKQELTASQVYKKRLESEFKEKWHENVLGIQLLKHTYHRTANVTRDTGGTLQDATVVSTIFSPYFLPRAIQVCMRYHRLPDNFWCSWHIQFVSLTEVKDDKMAYWRPHLTDMWELCSNGYAKMPTNEIGFMAVEEIDTAYLTPNMVRKIRKWLFGSINSVDFCDDLALLKYVLGTCGAVNDFTVIDADIGYTWRASEAQAKDMSLYGNVSKADIDKATTTGTNWLEFQCRMISSSLRLVDHWFDPYDGKYYKGVWGEKVMEYRYRKHGIFEQDEHIRANPHKIWELALKGIVDTTLEHKVMRVVGTL